MDHLDRDQDNDHNPDWDLQDREWVQDHERDCPSVHEKERNPDQEWEHYRDYDRDCDHLSTHYKYRRGKKRSHEDRDDYHESIRDTKA